MPYYRVITAYSAGHKITEVFTQIYTIKAENLEHVIRFLLKEWKNSRLNLNGLSRFCKRLGITESINDTIDNLDKVIIAKMYKTVKRAVIPNNIDSLVMCLALNNYNPICIYEEDEYTPSIAFYENLVLKHCKITNEIEVDERGQNITKHSQ